MEKTAVVSSNIDAVGYDAEAKQLFILFKNGTSYRYDDVGYTVYDQLIKAESVGKTFNQFVKPNYSFTKLEKSPF